MAGAALLSLQACSPDEYSMDSMKYSAENLTQGSAYTVSADANDPNLIHCASNLSGVQSIWETPNGRFIGKSCDLSLPFAGDYWIVFGVMENGGVAFGDTCKFTVSTNNFTSLTDQLWTNLTGGIGKSKKWVPVNKDYGVGQCTAPVMYMSPDDVQNNGKGIKDLKLNNGGKDNWSPNWDPGFQSWLIPADSKYLDSYMTFSLSEANGCTIECYQGEKDVTSKGKFNFNISDKQAPLISFMDGAYSMHNASFDDVCANYTSDIKIIELTPYMLQIATMRTNSEGPWWLVWNFIAADVHDGIVEIPNDNVLESAPVVAPVIDDLETKLFTIEGDNGTYLASSVTYLFNEDKAYDYYWWNGANGAWTEREVYGNDIYPKVDVSDFALTLTKNGGNITFEEEATGAKGIAVIEGSKIKFMSEPDAAGVQMEVPVKFFNNGSTAAIETAELQVVLADPANSKFFFALPDTKDASGVVNQYIVANLTQKSIFAAPTGPVAVAVDNEKTEIFIEADKYLRCQLYNPWGGKNECLDINKLVVKKDQKITIKFKVSGVDWTADPKAVLCDNALVNIWEPDAFNHKSAIALNKDGENTITVVNETGAKFKYSDGTSALAICIQLAGYGTIPGATADNAAEGVKFEIISLTIE